MTGVTSHAALGQLTISKSVYDKDVLLQLITKLVAKEQLATSVVTSKGATPISLQYADITLTHRNSILRALCGRTLLYALDQAPYYLLGGQAMSPSPAAAVTLASITEWMSVASELSVDVAGFVSSLNEHLETRSFMASTPQASLADLDLALALALNNENIDVSNAPHVGRWWRQCHAVLTDYASQVGLDLSKLPTPPTAPAPVLPVFFYGTEDAAQVLKQAQPQAAKPKEEPAGGGKKKQPQGGKQQQQEQQPQGKKKEKKAKQPQQQQQAAASYTVHALDMRVGQITKVWEHPEAEKLFCEEVDFGNETRQIASGLRPFYQASDLEHRKVVVLYNLKKRNLVGFPSHGMVLCASNSDHTKVELVVPPADTPLGERVVFQDVPVVDPEPENKVAKKKIFEGIAPDLKTDDQGRVVYQGAMATTSGGVVQAVNGMANAQVS